MKNSTSLIENTKLLAYLYISTLFVMKLTLMLMFLWPARSPPGGTAATSQYTLGACSWCIPDIKVIWYSIEPQSGKASEIVTVVVQCDGSQGDFCREYEQQSPIPISTPYIKVPGLILPLSKVGISQFELCSITIDEVFRMVTWWKITSWIVPTVGTGTLSSVDRVILIGILWRVHLTWSGGYCRVEWLVKFAWSHS